MRGVLSMTAHIRKESSVQSNTTTSNNVSPLENISKTGSLKSIAKKNTCGRKSKRNVKRSIAVSTEIKQENVVLPVKSTPAGARLENNSKTKFVQSALTSATSQKHYESFIAILQRYRLEGYLCDTVLTTGPNVAKEYRVHSVLLAAVSPVFDVALQSAFAENPNPSWRQIHLQDTEEEMMEIALDFVYTGRLVFPVTFGSSDRLMTLLRTFRDLEISLDRLNGCEIIVRDTNDCEQLFSNETFTYEDGYSDEEVVSMLLRSFNRTIYSTTAQNYNPPISERHANEHDNAVDVISDSVRILNNAKSLIDSRKKLTSALKNKNYCAGKRKSHFPTHREKENIDSAVTDIVAESLNVEVESSKECVTLEEESRVCELPDSSNVYNALETLSEGPYECDKSSRIFTDSKSLTSHTRSPHSKEKSHRCHKCTKRFSQLAHLKRHEASHGRRYKCNECDQFFVRKSYLAVHALVHSGKKTHRCSKCTKCFSLLGNLQRHEASHAGERPYLCHLCGRSYTQKVTLIDHMSIHYGEHYMCDVCPKVFTKASQLRLHIRRHMGRKKRGILETDGCGNEENSCSNKGCDKHLNSSDGLQQRKQEDITTKPRPFKCTLCTREFTTKLILTQHAVTHSTLKPFACETCGKCYKRKHQLVWHAATHGGAEGESAKLMKCETCGKTFSSPQSLVIHKRTHTGEKPYACTMCQKTFLQANHLRVHTRSHTGESPFVCEYCPKRYRVRYDLRLHCARVHLINIAKWSLVKNDAEQTDVENTDKL